MKLKVGALLLLSISFLFITHQLFLKFPHVWPDESIYADVAQTFLTKGTLSTSLWHETMPGSERCACWYPPLFFYSLAVWFKLFGFSIITQRLMSVVLGICFLFLFFVFSQKCIQKKKSVLLPWPSIALIVLLGADVYVLSATRISRPEIMILCIGYFSLYLYMQSRQQGPRKKREYVYLFLSGVTAALTVLTHFISIFFFLSILFHLVIVSGKKIVRSRSLYSLIGGFMLPIGIWMVLNFHNLPITYEQLHLIGQLKGTYTIGLPLDVRYALYYVITISYLVYVIKNARHFIETQSYHLLVGMLLLSSWTLSFVGKMHWYFVYPVTFLYLGSYLIGVDWLSKNNISKISMKQCVYSALACLTLGANIFLHIQLMQQFSSTPDAYSYNRFRDYFSRIEAHKTVFLFSIPDAYYVLRERPDITLYKYVDLPTSAEKYYELLNLSDYIVYNGSFRNNDQGRMVTQYIRLNTQKVYDIREPFQYQVTIVKLTPRSQRVRPH